MSCHELYEISVYETCMKKKEQKTSNGKLTDTSLSPQITEGCFHHHQ